jgi:pimeloyl-ACP methyl ester carboxylesterase
MLREQTFDTGEVALSYAEGAAAGPPLVLVHGITNRWQSWLPGLGDAALRWHIHAIDLRGHGRSGRAAGAYRGIDYAHDIVSLLGQRVAGPAAIVGHSLGAIAAIAAAAEAPEAVRAIVLEDPPLAPYRHQSMAERPEHATFSALRDLIDAPGTVDELAARLAAHYPRMDAAGLRYRAASLRRVDPEVLAFALDDTRRREGYDLDGLLRKIACPALLLVGNVALGGVLEDGDARHAAKLMSRCTVVPLSQCGHGIHRELPVVFWRHVLEFLESL